MGGVYSAVQCCTESVPRRQEGSTGKYQLEVKGVPEGAARGNSPDRIAPDLEMAKTSEHVFMVSGRWQLGTSPTSTNKDTTYISVIFKSVRIKIALSHIASGFFET